MVQDEDGEETGEDVSRDDRWNYADILWNGIHAEAVQKAFVQLDYREQALLEGRNAICMTCGRVNPLRTRMSFEDLAIRFEGSTASGAERAYRRAVEHLSCLLAEAGAVHVVRLKRKSQTRRKKKIAAAVYLYQVAGGGEWGEIIFDFETGTAEILRLADWDTVKTNRFAHLTISHILALTDEILPKDALLTFET